MNKETQNSGTINLDALKDYRKKQNISIETAADGMKVSKDYIRYIEAGHFEKLGAPTFLRGHITNYCKVLGLDPNDVLFQIPSQFLQYQQMKTSDALGASPLARVKRQSNHLGRYAVGTALLGMLCLSFYFVWDKWSVPQNSQTIDSISLSQEDNADKKITYSSLIPQVSGPGLTQESEDLNNQTTAEEATENDRITPTEAVGANDSNNEDELDDTADDGSLLPQNTISSVYTIKMELAEQAWVSIKTQNGEKIVHDLIGPGLREYHSDQPMHFRIGNVETLQLLINDNQVELSELSEEDIADFNWPLNPSS